MTTVFLASAALLGLLAFFEPCTIATHTLFSARAHQQPRAGCCQGLSAMWLARCVLLAVLLVAAVAFTPPPAWGTWLPSIILAVMGAVYIVSRFTYIPVPHLEFFKLLPGGRSLPFAIQLGLTLPACTIPLFLVVIGLAVSVDSISFAVLAGLLFATLFTAPMVITAFNGVHADGREFLNRVARGSPYLTAVLLFGAALYLLIPALDVSTDTLKTALQQASWAGVGLGFLAGFVFSFNPVSFASIPVVLAYVTKAHEERRAILMGGAFVAGLIVTHVALGVAAALGGEWVKAVMGREWGLVLGPVLIVLGLMWSGWLKLRLPWMSIRAKKVTGVWGAFLLGIPFSVAVCPFCTPALLVTLTASVAIGSVPFGFGLLLAFALGRSIPIILGAWSMGWLESLGMLSHHQKALEIIAGVTLILTGLYLLNEYFFIIKY
ncbi:cytochrome c biogenesis CcdA family protein [Sulfuriflexus sp.]|uniref:cytochrome c biogenesis CcdA family protein n=1 Tax=Sulfuriflexus sp. TaxID=2015443 RepID=UPI0028CE93E6|nr:cytochrome c biogenesis protein CcdA [Sulfuriflexus sp.]MDT8404675.1 cytochrome c biogenesis protein CcdA [Sulfuriflexus sp.]